MLNMPDEADEVAPEFWHGVDQFNQGEFYACHDTLEAIWMEATDPQKTFYQGVLQLAVALYHLSNQNLRGAVILLGEGVNRLRRYQPTYAGVDVAELVDQSLALLVTLQHTPPEQVPTLAEQVAQYGKGDFKREDSETENSETTVTLSLPVISKAHIG